jgi:hypothetical protein
MFKGPNASRLQSLDVRIDRSFVGVAAHIEQGRRDDARDGVVRGDPDSRPGRAQRIQCAYYVVDMSREELPQ